MHHNKDQTNETLPFLNSMKNIEKQKRGIVDRIAKGKSRTMQGNASLIMNHKTWAVKTAIDKRFQSH